MARFRLTDGDVTVLTRAFNGLREGMGTKLDGDLEAFLGLWKASPWAFSSESGFIGVNSDGQPQGSALLTMVQFESGAVDALLGEDLRKLARELFKAMNLVVLRAMADAEQQGDRLLTLAGFTRDGVLRKLVPDGDGVLRDVSMYSLTVDDLEAAPVPLNGVGREEVNEHLRSGAI